MAILGTYGQFRAVFATSALLANDGYRIWPVANVNQAGFTGLTKPSSAGFNPFPMTLHATGSLVADSVFGTDQYDWYVSQRTDDPARQMLSITQYPPTTSTYSGSIVIDVTSLATSTFGTGTEDAMVGILRHVDIYVQRRSDDLIQHLLPLSSLLASL